MFYYLDVNINDWQGTLKLFVKPVTENINQLDSVWTLPKDYTDDNWVGVSVEVEVSGLFQVSLFFTHY